MAFQQTSFEKRVSMALLQHWKVTIRVKVIGVTERLWVYYRVLYLYEMVRTYVYKIVRDVDIGVLDVEEKKSFCWKKIFLHITYVLGT